MREDTGEEWPEEKKGDEGEEERNGEEMKILYTVCGNYMFK